MEMTLTAHHDMLRIATHPVLGDDPRHDTVSITFDGKLLTVLAGETVATALRAHGGGICRTMPDSRSPRGLYCGVGRCPDCMMTVDGELNVRTCIRPVRDGMVIETQQGLGVWTVRE